MVGRAEQLSKRVKNETNKEGFCYIAHPFSKHHKWLDFDKVLEATKEHPYLRGFELLHRDFLNQVGRLLATWNRHLAQGERILVIGGNDAHKAATVGEKVKTFAYVENEGKVLDASKHQDLLYALKHGHPAVTTGPLAVFTARNNSRSSKVYRIGEEMPVHDGDDIEINIASAECQKHRPIYALDGKIRRMSIGDGERFPRRPERITLSKEGGFMRLEGYGKSGTCYINPIFLVREEEASMS